MSCGVGKNFVASGEMVNTCGVQTAKLYAKIIRYCDLSQRIKLAKSLIYKTQFATVFKSRGSQT